MVTTRQFSPDRLWDEMVAADATPAKLADILGVTRTTVLRWLTGEHAPHLAMRAAIARAFAIEPDDLLEER